MSNKEFIEGLKKVGKGAGAIMLGLGMVGCANANAEDIPPTSPPGIVGEGYESGSDAEGNTMGVENQQENGFSGAEIVRNGTDNLDEFRDSISEQWLLEECEYVVDVTLKLQAERNHEDVFVQFLYVSEKFIHYAVHYEYNGEEFHQVAAISAGVNHGVKYTQEDSNWSAAQIEKYDQQFNGKKATQENVDGVYYDKMGNSLEDVIEVFPDIIESNNRDYDIYKTKDGELWQINPNDGTWFHISGM